MGEQEVFEYSLNVGEIEHILKMSKIGKHICFIIENQNNQKYTAYVTLAQLKKVCKAFKTTKTLNELLIILHNNIEAGNISLPEDEQGTSIYLKFFIKLASGNFPPFVIKLELQNENSLKVKNEPKNELPAKFDYRGNIEAEKKYGKSTKNTTEYNKPIIQPNFKKPIIQLEYIEPILQVHYPDGTIKSKVLPARIQTVDGKIPDIDEAQFKRIQEEMNKHMANQVGSKYSSQTVVVNNYSGNLLESIAKENNNDKEILNRTKSKYSTFSVPAKPIIYPEQKVIKNGSNQYQYNNNNDKNNIIEYAPNIINQDKYNINNTNTYSNTYSNTYNNTYSNTYSNTYIQSNEGYNYDDLINQGNSYNYNSYNNYNNYTNYSNLQSSSYQDEYYSQNSFDINSILNQNQDQNYQYQPQSYQYQNNDYSSSYQQSFPQQFEQAFAEVIPLNPFQEFLQAQMQPKTESSQEQVQKEEQVEKEEDQKEEDQKEEDQKEEDHKEEDHKEEDQKEEDHIEEDHKEEDHKEEDHKEEENNTDDNEIIENRGEIEDGRDEERGGEQNDIETLYQTEDGLIIFRNGILKGIIQKYSEIDKIVTKIQDILLKGAKFKLLYKATIHGDKASIFHEKCDNHRKSLVIVETDKGIRFGGFTTKSWEGHCLKKIDNDAFVFSVDKNKIYEIVINQPAVGCYPKFGPVFFGCQIRIYNDFFTKGGSTCYKGLNYKTTNDFELNNGEQTYIVKDIEVYGIETIDV